MSHDIQTIDPCNGGEWMEFIHEHPDADVFHHHAGFDTKYQGDSWRHLLSQAKFLLQAQSNIMRHWNAMPRQYLHLQEEPIRK